MNFLIFLQLVFIFVLELAAEASDAQRDLQLHYSTLSVLREEQKRLAELDSTQLESQ